jgi:hypothetical protein
MDRTCMVFCAAALGGCLALAAVAFPFAAMPREQLDASRKAMSAEQFADVDLGDFGQVSVLELIDHYIENPPAEPASQAGQVRFQGC